VTGGVSGNKPGAAEGVETVPVVNKGSVEEKRAGNDGKAVVKGLVVVVVGEA